MEIDIPDLNDVEFSETCHSCWGTGRSRRGRGRPSGRCLDCDGSGKICTPVGHKLITFLRDIGVETYPFKEKD